MRRQYGGFFNGKIGGEEVRVPAEDHASLDGFDIHVGASDRSAVIGGVFDHFFMEAAVLPPASYRVELPKIEGKSGDVKIGLDSFG